MTAFSKTEAKSNGITAIVEIKTLNGRYLEIQCRVPKTISNKEFNIREILKTQLIRGSVNVYVTIDYNSVEKPFNLNEDTIIQCYKSLNKVKTRLKLNEPVTLDNVLNFSSYFSDNSSEDNSEIEWKLVYNALREGIKQIQKMRKQEGGQLEKDLKNRIKNIEKSVESIEVLASNRITELREKLRQKVAQLFESDEIDERRIQMEIVLIADKLDISEECVRLHSHLKFFNEAIKSKDAAGRKINFLLQEMNREVNTIGSKSEDVEISKLVIDMKEELERIREQAQNIE